MTDALALQRVDDALRSYWVLSGKRRIGEVRERGFGTSELHLCDAGYLLRRDDTADALKARAGIARALLSQVMLRGRYSLRDGEQVLACAERRFSLSTRQDGIHVRPDAGADNWWSLAKRDGLRRPWSIQADGNVVGHVAEHGWIVAWHGPAVPEPVAVFALYALHQQFGMHPSSGGDGGGE